jgi:hypothetical protein
MGAAVLASLIAAGLGLIAGGYYSVLGWVLIGNLLLVTTAGAAIAGQAQFLLALGWAAALLVAFNLGLGVSLLIRGSATLRRA